MRKGVRANSRDSFVTLFYDGTFNTPLTPDKAGSLAGPLELVRWAPSAVNKQPRRAAAGKNRVDKTGWQEYNSH